MTTVEQRMSALDLANQVRLERAKIKLRIGSGDLQAWRVILDPPACLNGVDCFTFVSWLPRSGPVRTTTLTRRAKVDSRRSVGSLIPEQRERLSQVLHDYAHPSKASDFNAECRRIMRGEKGEA